MTRLVVLDFETYYDKEFSLSKMTTEAYIRDDRFEVIGVGVKVDDHPTDWFSGTMEETAQWLKAIPWDDTYLVCHHTAFDGAILKWRFGIEPKYYFDTLSMARPITQLTVGGSLAKLATHYNIGKKGTEVVNALGKRRADFTHNDLWQYGEYCRNDVELCRQLFDILKPGVPAKELYIIDLMLRMFIDPVLELSTETLEQHLVKVQDRKARLMDKLLELHESITTDMVERRLDGETKDEIVRSMLMSNPQFAEVLKKLGVEPPTKISLRTNKETYAFGKTDVEFKKLLEHEDERVQAVVAARLGIKSTLEETRTQAFIGISQRGTLPILLNYYGAHTGRASGGDKINLQNLPRGGELRQSIQAPEGHQLVACDSSQIEARVVAWLADETDLVEGFRNNVDIYSNFATDVYNRPINRKRKEIVGGKEIYPDVVEGFVGKTCLSEGTLVLSNRGWKPIETITTTDLLWDGEEWVCHRGLVNNGIKPTLNLCGVWLTPDHQVWSGTSWMESQLVAADEDTLFRSLDTGAENLPLQAMWLASEEESNPSSLSVTATTLSTQLISRTSRALKALDALFAPRKRLLQNVTGFTAKQCLTMSTGLGYSIASLQQSLGATHQHARRIGTTAGEELKYANNGAMTVPAFCSMSRLLTAGKMLLSRWTELMSMAIMNQGISDSYREAITSTTSEKYQTLRKSLQVYDLACAGPRHRFTVLTEAGPLIVHNCILGLGYGMGKDKFKATLKIGQAGVSVDMPIEDAERVVNLYRAKYPNIVKLWKQGQEALVAMSRGHEYELGTKMKLKCASNKIFLPNGMYISYPNLRKVGDGFEYDARYGATKIYGGKLIENVVQALARIIVFDQMAKIDQDFRKKDKPNQRFKVALTVHDEVVSCVPNKFVNEVEQFMIQTMSVPPKWCEDLPVACEANYGETYGDCK